MRILITSDSHGWQEPLAKVIDRHESEVDGVIHCGDSELSEDAKELKNVFVVQGNCDFQANFPKEIVDDIQGVRFLAVHGHLHQVKTSPMPLAYRGEEVSANVVCFGHTHVPTAFEEKGMLFINPGSLRLPRSVSVATYVILTIDESGSRDVSYYTLEGDRVDALSQTF
ncbi:YfcE family phosphodiesterase [Texcoconibacillus texcoconensis]|uniref:Phosphoesterase n=1 Tax=Texcoconibacillus texcoconensis TaxID=1095777 RepID=A0A840QMQ8_9BACI|nr:hypothetical protein [Texcoconibacillus texcoconensis]